MYKFHTKKRYRWLALSFITAVTGCQSHHTNKGDELSPTVAVEMESSSQSNVKGVIRFSEDNGVVTMQAEFSGLNHGSHAIHIHENADCSAVDGKSAGGHWNPSNEQHGKWGSGLGYHKGDIGNFAANRKGLAVIEKVTDEWCLTCGDEQKNIVGQSIIVHEGTDDFTSQPSGDAGIRIACGEILK